MRVNGVPSVNRMSPMHPVNMCYTCRKKNESSYIVDKLKRVEDYIMPYINKLTIDQKKKGEMIVNRLPLGTMFDYHFHCPYGMHCPQSQSFNVTFQGKLLSKHLCLFALYYRDKLHNVYPYLQGTFPMAINVLQNNPTLKKGI